MSSGPLVQSTDPQMQEWGVRDPPEINDDCRTLTMLKVADVMAWITDGKPKDNGTVKDNWWVVRHKG